MPRGTPKNGFRMTRKRRLSGDKPASVNLDAPVITETDAEIAEKLNDRFSILEMMTKAAVNGDARAVIVSGPAGLGLGS